MHLMSALNASKYYKISQAQIFLGGRDYQK